MHLFCRHHQRAAVIGEAIGDIHLGELGNNRAAVFIREIVIQHAVIGRFRPQHQRHHDGDSGGGGNDKGNTRVSAQASDKVTETFFG